MNKIFCWILATPFELRVTLYNTGVLRKFFCFFGKPDGRRRRGRPRKRWLGDLEEDLRKLGVKGWRRKAEDLEEWRHVVKTAEAVAPTRRRRLYNTGCLFIVFLSSTSVTRCRL